MTTKKKEIYIYSKEDLKILLEIKEILGTSVKIQGLYKQAKQAKEKKYDEKENDENANSNYA